MAEYLIQDTTLTGIASAVRNLCHETDTLTPIQIEEKIRSSRLGVPIEVTTHINPETGEWDRPQDYPDIDALAENIVGDQDCVYLTYDLRKTVGYGWIGLYAKTSDTTPWTVDRGHIADGAFVSDETVTINHNSYLRQALNSANGNIQLFRVTATGHITEFGFATNSATSGECFNCNLQPCVQRSGTLPWCTKWSDIPADYSDSKSGGTVWLERDSLIPGKNAVVTSLAWLYLGCYSLQSVDFSGWITNLWEVTYTTSMFGNCYSLQSLDLSHLNVSNWVVTNMAGMFSCCYSLRSVNLSGWFTTGWAVTETSGLFNRCFSLRELDLNDWNTENWAVTNMSTMFGECFSLESLKIGDWDTSNWAVSNLSGMFSSCYSLQSLDIADWDTSNWSVTDLSNLFDNCHRLCEINIGGWDTSEWAVTTLSSMFWGCYGLRELDLSEWNTSNWVVTTIANMFNGCRSLRSLDISTWNTGNWAVTSTSGIFNNCTSLQSLDISDWNTGNWDVTVNGSMFTGCVSLKTLSTPASMGIRSSQTAGTSATPNLDSIENFNGYAVYISHYYSTARKLTHDSLVSIIDRLPTVSGKTITLGQSNKNKLTAAEIAVATGKGWTVA